jgi:hypothetical protein
MLTHLYDDHGAWTQRKNAANKLQHSGVATVVVYHIRHPMVHHIDMEGIPTPPRGAANREKPHADAPTSTLERGPDFAERPGVHLFEISAWDMGHTALC